LIEAHIMGVEVGGKIGLGMTNGHYRRGFHATGTLGVFAACRGDDPQFEQRSSGSRGLVEVEVRLRDGRSDRLRVECAPGSPARELSWSDLRAKFMDCARQSQRISENAANEAFEAVRKLEHLGDVTRLTDLLR